MSTGIDWTPFTAPLAAGQIQQWKAAAQAANHRWAGDGIWRVALVLVICAPVLLLFAVFGIALIVGSVAGFASGDPGGVGLGVLALLGGILCLGLTALATWGLTKLRPNERRWERWLRLDWFARANGLTFSPHDPDPNYPGSIFRNGGSRAAVDHFRPVDGRFFDVGNFQYVVSNGKSSTTHTWGFLALHLERRLPHMLLDSLANNMWGMPGLAGLFARDQVLSLEGDFDRFFTLYCPRQYERDALYVFTPDLMALCIDEVAPFDVEIVDDWMFVYSPRAFAMEDPRLLSRIFRIIDLVGAKALRQTRRYHDDRTAAPFPANVVAPPGQRLRRRFPVGAIVALCLVLGLPVLVGLIVVFGAVLSVAAGG